MGTWTRRLSIASASLSFVACATTLDVEEDEDDGGQGNPWGAVVPPGGTGAGGATVPGAGACEPMLSGKPELEGSCNHADAPPICEAPASTRPPSEVLTATPDPGCLCPTCTTGVRVTARAPDGVEWSVALSVPGLDAETIQPGDEIAYEFYAGSMGFPPAQSSTEIIARREGVGLVAYLVDGRATSDPLQICAFHPICGGAGFQVGCEGEQFDIAVTVDDETGAVKAGTTAQVGPLVVFNAHYYGLIPTGYCDYGSDRVVSVSAARPSG